MKRYKMLSIFLVFTMIISQTALAFASVSDISETHWARKTVESVVENDLMALFEGNAFKPTRAVSHVETIVVIYRAAKNANLIDPDSIESLVAFYEKELENMGIPQKLSPYGDDVYPAMSYAIENSIITPEEAKTFVKDDTLTTINKTSAAVFFGRALNVFKQENLNKLIVLEYKDEASIPLHSRRFIQFLIENNILSPTGDNLGNFNPLDPMNRILLAAMLNNYYNVLLTFETNVAAGESDKEEVVTEIDKEIPKRIYSGHVISVNDKEQTLVIKEELDQVKTIDFEHAKILHEDALVGKQGLYPGAMITVTERYGIVMEIVTESMPSTLVGQLSLVGAKVAVEPPFRSLRVTLDDKTHEHRRLYEDTPIVINGKSVDASALKIGDRLWVQFEEQDVKRVVGFSGQYETIAVLLEDFTEKTIVTLTQEGYVHEFSLGANASLINASSGLKKDTIVKLRIQNGVVTRMEPIGKQEALEGKVIGIHIKESPELTILVEDKKVTHALKPSALISDDAGKPGLSIYDLRLDQLVTVYVGIGGIDALKMGHLEKPISNEDTYVIREIFDSAGLLTVLDQAGNSKTVITSKNSAIQLSKFSVGDVIVIEGKALTEGVLEAEIILLVE